jgi:hypothetical protein
MGRHDRNNEKGFSSHIIINIHLHDDLSNTKVGVPVPCTCLPDPPGPLPRQPAPIFINLRDLVFNFVKKKFLRLFLFTVADCFFSNQDFYRYRRVSLDLLSSVNRMIVEQSVHMSQWSHNLLNFCAHVHNIEPWPGYRALLGILLLSALSHFLSISLSLYLSISLSLYLYLSLHLSVCISLSPKLKAR